MAVICDRGRCKSLMWEPLAQSGSGSKEAHAGCAAWANKPLCVLEWITLLPHYQFTREWFFGDDINDKQSILVSSIRKKTAALNFNNFWILSWWSCIISPITKILTSWNSNIFKLQIKMSWMCQLVFFALADHYDHTSILDLFWDRPITKIYCLAAGWF